MRSLFSLSFRERFFLLGLFGSLFLGLFVLLTMGLIGEVDLNTGGTYCIDRKMGEDPPRCDRDYLKIVLHHLEVVAPWTVIVVLPAVAFVYLCLVALHLIPRVDAERERASPAGGDPQAARQRLISNGVWVRNPARLDIGTRIMYIYSYHRISA